MYTRQVHSGIVYAKNVTIDDRLHIDGIMYHVRSISTNDGADVVFYTHEGKVITVNQCSEVDISWVD